MADDEGYLSMAVDDDGNIKSPADATKQGISGIILALSGILITIVAALGDGLSKVIGVLSDFRDLVATFFTSPEVILNQTAQYSADALTVGDWAFFGPFTWAVGVLAIVAGFVAWTTFNPKIPFVDKLLPWR